MIVKQISISHLFNIGNTDHFVFGVHVHYVARTSYDSMSNFKR